MECGRGSWTEDFGEAGAYFRSKQPPAAFGRTVSGYGRPITVFVVRDVAGKAGLLARAAVGLRHDRPRARAADRARARSQLRPLAYADARHLMHPVPDSETMTPLQQAVFRNSRHVTLR